MRSLKFGFTLIELLIVIALLGALAVGLLAALDPFEQLKKGTDTGVRNTTAEYQGATIRYYAIKNYMPWCTDSTCGTFRDGSQPTGAALTSQTNAIAEIVSTGELKTDFSNLAGGQLAKIFVTGTFNPPVIIACFQPTSKSFINDPNTIYDVNGVAQPTGTCKGNGGSSLTCYWCVK